MVQLNLSTGYGFRAKEADNIKPRLRVGDHDEADVEILSLGL